MCSSVFDFVRACSSGFECLVEHVLFVVLRVFECVACVVCFSAVNVLSVMLSVVSALCVSISAVSALCVSISAVSVLSALQMQNINTTAKKKQT